MTGKPPPRSVGELAKRVRAYANTKGIAESRVRLWIAHMALAGAFTNEAPGVHTPLITVKGGVAVELRLGVRARATRDLDVTVHSGDLDRVEALEDALGAGYKDFRYRRSGEPHEMPNGTVRVRVAVEIGVLGPVGYVLALPGTVPGSLRCAQIQPPTLQATQTPGLNAGLHTIRRRKRYPLQLPARGRSGAALPVPTLNLV